MDIKHLLENKISLTTMHTRAKHIIVVGAGGTGGYLIPNLARQVSLQNQIRQGEGLPPHTLTIVDADIVESKNLVRQNFVAQDIGKNKAEVMASRYGRGYQMNINFVADYIKDHQRLIDIANTNVHGGQDDAIVLIDCVDNNKTRKIFHDFLNSHYTNQQGNLIPIYYLSSGNEEFGGQVIFSLHNTDSSVNIRRAVEMSKERPINSLNYSSISLFDIFPGTLEADDEFPDEGSCAENAVSAPQNIFTNMTAANILYGFMNQLLTQRDKGIDEFAVFFNAQKMTQRVMTSTISQIEEALKMTPDNPLHQHIFPPQSENQSNGGAVSEGLDARNLFA